MILGDEIQSPRLGSQVLTSSIDPDVVGLTLSRILEIKAKARFVPYGTICPYGPLLVPRAYSAFRIMAASRFPASALGLVKVFGFASAFQGS